ncbi:hypothetical protein H0H93_006808 [Arthromyces matolae]|nr:hypothetical protein H0H93_006808 [Arthromyces matolae]
MYSENLPPRPRAQQLAQNPRSFLQLPLEVLSLTQYFLDPIDIISLRLTCKRVSWSTKDRNAWKSVLRTVCATHGVFLPTFRFEEMTQRELEHAALVPIRFLSLISQENITVQPRAIRLLVPKDPAKFTELFLISGGRYLFTQTVDGRIELWDLGSSPASVIRPSPVASLAEDDQWESSIMALEPTNDGRGIYMIIRERAPTSKTFNNGINYFSASPGLCGVHHGFSFTIWDYQNDLSATWTVESESYSLISRGCALLFDNKGIKMWNIPELRPSTGNELDPHSIPLFSLQYARTSDHPMFGRCIPYTAWPRGEGRAEILGVMAQADGGPMLDYYTMEYVPGKHSPKLPNAIPILRASTNICKNDIRVIPAIALGVAE